MKNYFYQAKLIDMHKISIAIFSSMPREAETKVYFHRPNQYPLLLKVNRLTSVSDTLMVEVELPYDYPFGEACFISFGSFNAVEVDVTNAVDFPEFGPLFNYDGDDLGAIYSKKETSFNLWAPLASSVSLKLENHDGSYSIYNMERTDKGVYRISVNGDLLNRKYHYLVLNSGVLRETNDPFGKGTSIDSKYSAVVDYEKFLSYKRIKPSLEIKRNTDALIYELHVRDFTESKTSNIVNKGKYLGLMEEGRKTKQNHPAGLDYLKYLGVTHIQLQPILDYAGDDRKDLNRDYNWGYDPISFFALEGSYSNHPEIPQARLDEFRTLVDALHKNNLRVTVDVVYNHIHDYITSSFEATVPHYFYRKRSNGHIAQASGCGDDFASERYMARKAIVSSVKYLFEVFDIDGLRYDLMGLIDVDTINECVRIAKANKKDALMYGEGWNMGMELPYEKKACSDNADKLKDVFFFNDSFRDILKGSTFDKKNKGFVNGDFSYHLGYCFALMGSCVDYTFPHRFSESTQSLNYFECHDNNVLFDKLTFSNEGEDEDALLERVQVANALTIFSFGVPFIHMGQEIGKSKYGNENSYNVPNINTFDYDEVDRRFSMIEYFRNLVSFRNNELSFFKELTKPEEIKNALKFKNVEDKILMVNMIDKYLLIINVNNTPIPYALSDYYKLSLFKGGKVERDDLNIRNGMIAPRSIDILTKE